MPVHRDTSCGQRCNRESAIADSLQGKGPASSVCRDHCHPFRVEGVDERDDTWIASYVRTKLRTMAGDTFPISRHTTDYVAKVLQERFLTDTDAVLQHILSLAALRYLREGSSTVTLDDVRAVLGTAAPSRQ